MRRSALLLHAALLLGGSGCAAITNPVADAVPVRQVPRELLGEARTDEHTVPLNLLAQPRPASYLLAPGDVLGVYVEGFLGDKTMPLPVHVAPLVQLRDQRRQAPSLGYPLTVQDDGTVLLPQAGPAYVQGLNTAQASAVIRKVYADKQLLKAENDRVLVSLLYPRQEHVVVFRQEAASLIPGPEGVTSGSKRGTGHDVDLPGYENDVLHALAQTGGLPGLDACNEIVVFRNCFGDEAGREVVRQQLEREPGVRGQPAPSIGAAVVRIPLRLPAGAPLPIGPGDVVLHTGDVVFLESRDREVFFTGGLLPPGATSCRATTTWTCCRPSAWCAARWSTAPSPSAICPVTSSTPASATLRPAG